MNANQYVATLEARLAAIEDRPTPGDPEQAREQRAWAAYLARKRPVDPRELYHAPKEVLPLADHARPKAAFTYGNYGCGQECVILEDKPNAAYYHARGQCACDLCRNKRRHGVAVPERR